MSDDNDDNGENPFVFPKGHGALNEHGGEFTYDEHFAVFGRTTTTADVFDKPSQAYSRSYSTHQNTGKWIAESATVEETFKSGPPCLSMLAKVGVRTYQHNFLIQCITLFKKKYPDNWEEAIKWVNMTVLSPPGDADKLKEMIRTCRDKSYFYMCQEEPICSHCHSKACRLEKYGVGDGYAGAGRDLALTVLDSLPAIYFVGSGDNRMRLTGDELSKLEKYRTKCLEHQIKMPISMNQKDWLVVVGELIEEAVHITPSFLYRKNVEQLEILERYFGMHIPMNVRAFGDEFLHGKTGDNVRVRVKDERIYFKWDKLQVSLTRASVRYQDIKEMRAFIDAEASFHTRTDMRGWFRSSWSFPFSHFPEDVVHHWLHPDEVEEEDNG